MTRAAQIIPLFRARALGAVIAQIWQAAGSFALLLVAAWLLGAAGLGLLSLCLGVIVLATAIASGMVGDSLTILDRHDRHIRGGLEFWALALVAASMLVTAVGLAVARLLTPGQAVLFALAMAAFQLEELVRRIFMATMRFWRLVIIDSTAVLCAVGIVAIWSLVADFDVAVFFLALLVGQVSGIAVGIAMLPAAERAFVSMRGGNIRRVGGFGAWRGAQVSIPPLVLTAVRVIITLTLGAAALGEVEAARIYAAPALLAVQGFGSYLLSSYVRDKDLELQVLVRRAWAAALFMIGAALAFGAILTILAPLTSAFVTGPNIPVDRLAVAGWALFVAGTASCQPFASLAAARGRQIRVFVCRCIDATFAIGLVAFLVGLVGASAAWTPFALAAGVMLGGALVRQFVLRPLTHSQLGQPVDIVAMRTGYATQ
jgi:O-antigen/teichoic acid export membrane protein